MCNRHIYTYISCAHTRTGRENHCRRFYTNNRDPSACRLRDQPRSRKGLYGVCRQRWEAARWWIEQNDNKKLFEMMERGEREARVGVGARKEEDEVSEIGSESDIDKNRNRGRYRDDNAKPALERMDSLSNQYANVYVDLIGTYPASSRISSPPAPPTRFHQPTYEAVSESEYEDESWSNDQDANDDDIAPLLPSSCSSPSHPCPNHKHNANHNFNHTADSNSEISENFNDEYKNVRLPENWFAALDPVSDRYYYIYLPTLHTQWDFPVGPPAVGEERDGTGNGRENGKGFLGRGGGEGGGEKDAFLGGFLRGV